MNQQQVIFSLLALLVSVSRSSAKPQGVDGALGNIVGGIIGQSGTTNLGNKTGDLVNTLTGSTGGSAGSGVVGAGGGPQAGGNTNNGGGGPGGGQLLGSLDQATLQRLFQQLLLNQLSSAGGLGGGYNHGYRSNRNHRPTRNHRQNGQGYGSGNDNYGGYGYDMGGNSGSGHMGGSNGGHGSRGHRN